MEKKQLNVGLNLFRILLTFGVVLDHFWLGISPAQQTQGVTAAFYQLRTMAVPAFMTMTFFFTARRFIGGDVPWLKKRYVRLYEPFCFWAVVYWLVHLAVMRFDARYGVAVSDLLWQLFLGSSRHLCTQFWFHTDLIILTALFFLAFRLVKCPRANIYLGLGALTLSYTLQYTSLNEAVFGWMPYEAKYPLGRVAPMMAYAGMGFLLAAVKDRLNALPGGVKVALALCGIWLAWWVTYCKVCPRPGGSCGYAGVNLSLIAWGLMAAFYFLPFDRLPEAATKVVLGVSKYCMGVYCVHLLLGQIVFDFVLQGTRMDLGKWGQLPHYGLGGCLAIWVLSYVFCWLFAKIPLAFCKRVVE